MKAVAECRGPLVAPLPAGAPFLRPMVPGAWPVAIRASTVPASTAQEFEALLASGLEVSWGSAPLMALSARTEDLPNDHPDREYLLPRQPVGFAPVAPAVPPSPFSAFLRNPPRTVQLAGSAGAAGGLPATVVHDSPPRGGEQVHAPDTQSSGLSAAVSFFAPSGVAPPPSGAQESAPLPAAAGDPTAQFSLLGSLSSASGGMSFYSDRQAETSRRRGRSPD